MGKEERGEARRWIEGVCEEKGRRGEYIGRGMHKGSEEEWERRDGEGGKNGKVR